MKVTPAMKRWAKAIASGRCTVRRTSITGARASGIVGGGGFTYVMASKMEDAGLIAWEPPTALLPGTMQFDVPSFDKPQVAALTAAGRTCF